MIVEKMLQELGDKSFLTISIGKQIVIGHFLSRHFCTMSDILQVTLPFRHILMQDFILISFLVLEKIKIAKSL